MNIAKGIKRLEIVLYGAWTVLFLIGVFTGKAESKLLEVSTIWIGGFGVTWVIAWVVEGFFGPKEPD